MLLGLRISCLHTCSFFVLLWLLRLSLGIDSPGGTAFLPPPCTPSEDVPLLAPHTQRMAWHMVRVTKERAVPIGTLLREKKDVVSNYIQTTKTVLG